MIDVFYIGSIVIATSNTSTVSKPAKFITSKGSSRTSYVRQNVELLATVGI